MTAGAESTVGPAAPAADDDEWCVPAAPAQERVWLAGQLDPQSPVYNVLSTIALDHAIDPEQVRVALGVVVDRHEALRAALRLIDGELSQAIRSSVPVDVEIVELSGLAAAEQRRRCEQAAQQLLGQPIMLEEAPLWRARLIRLGPARSLLCFVAHHAVFDAASGEILRAELSELCQAVVQGRAARLPELAVQYADYAAWHREQTEAGTPGLLDYWRRRLAGAPVVHQLPTDRPRTSTPDFAGGDVEFEIGDEVVAGIESLARSRGATPFMVLAAAFAVLMHRLTGQPDTVLAVPVAGRDHPDLAPLIGMFVNTIPVRINTGGNPPFAELVDRVRENVLDDFEHQDIPYQTLVRELAVHRDPAIPPLTQLGFNYLPEHNAGQGNGTTKHELSLELSRRVGRLEYSSRLFDRPTAAALTERLVRLLGRAVAEPTTRPADLPLLSEAETTELARFNDTARPFPRQATLMELFDQQAARTPDAPAVQAENGTLTFAECRAAANRVAHGLRALGVGPEVPVGICAHRSTDLVVGLLGILKAGGAYVPLDPDYPDARLHYMLDDAQAPVLVTQRALAGRFTATPAQVVELDDPARWAAGPDTDPSPSAGPTNAAYVIYTSGSTGRPKGVLNTHRGIVNRLDWMQSRYRLDATDAVLQKTPASFDVSVWEFFWPLITGARLVLARPGGHKDPAYLRSLIADSAITTLHFVPSMLAMFLADGAGQGCRSLRTMICSGEELPVDTAAALLAALPGCSLHNLYGPTEAAIDVSSWPCEPDMLAGRGPDMPAGRGPDMPTGRVRVPIGTPIQNIRLSVLDEHGGLVPPGSPGELHIGGVGVARGYLGRPGLTAERFVPDPDGPPGSRRYRTGDIAMVTAEGVLEFLGRADHQVKLRGQRIELGEVETALRGLPGVREAVAVVRADAAGDQQLVGYVTAGTVEAGDRPDSAEIRAELGRTLPEHLIPQVIVPLERLPVTVNGKLDRDALPAPDVTRSAAAPLAEPSTAAELAVLRVWQEVLGVAEIGVDDNFFDLGGHSMAAMRVVAALAGLGAESGRRIGVMDVFTERTVRGLAALLERPTADGGVRPLLYELTSPARSAAAPSAEPTCSFVCVPYGSGSAAVFQPLADAMPDGHVLWSVAVPGHDVGLDEGARPLPEVAARCAEEIVRRVRGPLVLYSHCGVGAALVIDLARELEAAGRPATAVYIGAAFPNTRPKGPLSALFRLLDRLNGNRNLANWLQALGADIAELPPDQVDRIIANMREETDTVTARFQELMTGGGTRISAPVISVIGERDPLTEYHTERYREWHALADRVALVVIAEAGHFFLKYRAAELADILTTTHDRVVAGPPDASADASADASPTDVAEPPTDVAEPPNAGDAGWSLREVHDLTDPATGDSAAAARPIRPGLGRFLVVAAGQIVSTTGTALTQWAIPVWIYLETGSLVRFGLFAVVSLAPGLLLSPLLGVLIDRWDRRRIMIASAATAGAINGLIALLLSAGLLAPAALYGLLAVLSVALACQRLSYLSAIPQLAPKHYLGHATGIAQLGTGISTVVVPLLAAAFLAAIGLGGILIIDIASYAFLVVTLAVLRFPNALAGRRRDTLRNQIIGGLDYTWRHPGLRAVLLYSAAINVFLGPLLLLIGPLVLDFGDLAAVGRVSFIEGLGALVGALAIGIWGGPRRWRMRSFLILMGLEAAFFLVCGLRPALPLIAVGAFFASAAAVMALSVLTTTVQIKVPVRYHGRTFAINQLISWSTLPLAYGIVAPYGARFAESLMVPGGPLAGTVGRVIGVGDGRGVALLYIVFSLILVVINVLVLRYGRLARFDEEVPDAPADDLIGAEVRGVRPVRAPAPGPVGGGAA